MKKVKKNILERFWWVLPLFAFDFFYYFFIQYMIENRLETGESIVINWEGVIFLFIISLFSIGCVRISDRLLSQFKSISLPWKYLINIFLSFFIFITVVLSFQYWAESGNDPRPISFFINISMVLLFLHLIVGNAAIAVSYYKDSMQLSERLFLMEKVKTEQELTILQQQMNPHFLFNNLNTLTSLIPVDEKKAVAFTRRLSSIFRHATDHTDKELISMDSEINFLEDYMELLSYRFGDSYVLDKDPINIDFSKFLAIPMAFQVIIENVVKHNIGSKSDPLMISLKMQGDYLEISNEIRPKLDHEEHRAGVGLKNLNQQYELVTGRSIIINNQKNTFSVQLPLIKEVKDEDINH